MRYLPRRLAGRPRTKVRTLLLEPLEQREMLAGTPWQNPGYRLDVNNSGVATPADVLAIVNRFLVIGIAGEDLPDPGGTLPPFYYDTNGDNRLTTNDLKSIVDALKDPPQVAISSLTPYTIDVTPQVTVTASSTPQITNDSVVDLDIDLNNDGDFSDPGELNHSQATFFEGSSTFQITPALERRAELYSVNLRAHVKNADGVVGTSPTLILGVDTLTSTALADYVNAPDPSYSFSIESVTPGAGFTYYVIGMTSQTWRSTDDVNLPVWHHWLEMYVPNGTIKNTALLLIDGGSNTSGPDAINSDFGTLATVLQSVMIDLKGIPNEPVIFTDDPTSRSEDAIIAYTFDKFISHLGEPGNETWPLLLPMVKSAVRAMDTVQSVVPAVKPGSSINDFVVTGYSKRGWTTWLTSATDPRVRAMMPGVFDNLNQGPQMVHHYGVYGFFSEAVQDYEDKQIFERLLTPESQQLSPITDPYRYLTNGRFDDMPKLIINSPGDEFFVSDSGQFYFSDIPGGTKNYLRYIPNTGHGLEATAVINSTTGFYDAVVNNRTLPTYTWTTTQSGEIHVQTPSSPTQVRLWQATNPTERDFRHLFHPEITWTSTTLVDQGGGNYAGTVPMAAGATAYFVELTFDNPTFLMPDYVFTTDVHVKSTLAISPWPFDPGSPLPPELALAATSSDSTKSATALAAVDPTRNAAATALAHQSDADPPAVELAAAILLPAATELALAGASASQASLMLAESLDDGADLESASDVDGELELSLAESPV